MQYSAVCLIAKDENYYIREWAEYHLRLGFDALIVYDNGSAAPLAETLDDLVAAGLVIVHEVPGPFAQIPAYMDCLERYRHAYKWIAFIDSDEFIFLKKARSIQEFLAEYENYGGVVANWVMFGTSGVRERQGNSQIFTFIMSSAQPESRVKSIVQPARTVSVGIHDARFNAPFHAVSSDHLPVPQEAYSAPFVNDAIQINHYYFRTWEDYERKKQRRLAMNRPVHPVSFEAEQQQHPLPDTGLIKACAALQHLPIPPYREEPTPDSLESLTAWVMQRCSGGILTPEHMGEVERMLCRASLVFPDEALIWYFRALLGRLKGETGRATRCIHEALKLSGSSTIYFELARIYQACGDAVKARHAEEQAEYKKRIEDTKCAPV